MTGRVPRGADRRNTGCYLLVPLVGPQTLIYLACKDAAVVLKQLFHAAFGSATHLPVVHPEFVFAGRDQDFGVRKTQSAISTQKTVDVILMIVRDDDRIDCT